LHSPFSLRPLTLLSLSGGCGAFFNLAHTTELAILTLSRHPNLVTDVQATTADVAENAENAENRDALLWARWLALRFPADVQQAAAARRVDLLKAARREGFGTIEQWDKVVYLSRHAAVPRRVAVLLAVLLAVRQFRHAPSPLLPYLPVSPLLGSIAGLPDDVVREVLGFVGDGLTMLERVGQEMEQLTAKNASLIRVKEETIAAQAETITAQAETITAQAETIAARAETNAAQVETLAARAKTLAARAETMQNIAIIIIAIIDIIMIIIIIIIIIYYRSLAREGQGGPSGDDCAVEPSASGG